VQDKKVHLYDWDGKALKGSLVLEGNKGVVSALAFSPDGNLLAAGDVCIFLSSPDARRLIFRMNAHSLADGSSCSMLKRKRSYIHTSISHRTESKVHTYRQ
jgi:WD40 repeat protein